MEQAVSLAFSIQEATGMNWPTAIAVVIGSVVIVWGAPRAWDRIRGRR